MLTTARQRIARILTWRRARAYALVLIGLYVVAYVDVLILGSLPLNSGGAPVSGDYIAFHTAGQLVASGQAPLMYDHDTVVRIQDHLLQGLIPGFYDAYRNPPFFALIYAPLSGLELLQGFVAWWAISLACLALAIKLLLDEVPALSPRWRGVLIFVFAFAPVYFGLIDGENATVSLLLYALIYRAFARKQDRPLGVWAALGLFKPQLFFVFPLIFLVTRRWQSLLSYALTAIVLAAISFAMVGADGTQAWFRVLLEHEGGNALANAWRMASAKSFLDTLLPSIPVVSLVTYAVVTAALLFLLWQVWRRPAPTLNLPVAFALTTLVAVLVDPHLVDYDLTVLVAAGIVAYTLAPRYLLLIVPIYLVTIFRVQLSVGESGLLVTPPLLLVLTVWIFQETRQVAWYARHAEPARRADCPRLRSRLRPRRLPATEAATSATSAMREFLRVHASSGGVLLVGTVVGGVLAYFSVALSARVLGAAEFGLLGALLGVANLAGVAARPAYLLVTHLTARTKMQGDPEGLRDLATAALAFSAGLGLVLLAGVSLTLPALESFFQMTEAGPLFVVALVIAGMVCTQFLTGFVSGLHRFRTIAFSTVADPLARVIVIAPLALLLGVSGSLLSYVAGLLVISVIAIRSIGGLGWSLPALDLVRGSLRIGGASIALTLAAALIQNLDLVLLRSYAPVDQVGFYAAAASLGNVLFALCAPLYLPAFPRTVSAHSEGKPTLPIVSEIVLLIGGICALAIVGSLVLGGSATQLLFGPTFDGVGVYVPAYLAKVTALLLLGTLSQYALAIGATNVIYVASAIAVLGPGVVFFTHPDPLTTAIVMVGFAAAGALSIALLLGVSGGARTVTVNE